MVLITTALLSNEVETIEKKQELNNILITFKLQKITYDGIKGFFIPMSGYSVLTVLLLDYLYLQDEFSIVKKRLDDYWKLDRKLRRTQTAFGVSLGVSIAELILIFCAGFFSYSLASLKL
jgi:hypothetical protein